MDVKDLMIGDFVLCKLNNKPVKVTHLLWDSHISTDKITPLHLSEIEPIPLTEEILLKNGWTTDEHETGLYRGKPYFGVVTIYAYMGKTWDLFDGNVTIQYVHELQHAINLCGLIKDIVV